MPRRLARSPKPGLLLQPSIYLWRDSRSAPVPWGIPTMHRPKSLSPALTLTAAFLAFACCGPRPAAAAAVCTAAMSAVSFGSVNVLAGSAVDTTGTLTISCSGLKKNKSYRFCTDIAAGADVSGSQRRMASGANRLSFDLYKDAARSQQWGNFANGFLGGGYQLDV